MTNTFDFFVSVIIPVYNASNYIEKAVLSALEQEETGEILLIDDGSNDGSVQLCENFANKYDKIFFFQHPDKKNHGISATRNIGIKNAKFNFIAFLDADDYYLPNRFKIAKQILSQNTEIDGVYEAIEIEFSSVQDLEIHKKNNLRMNITMDEIFSPDKLFENIEPIGNKGWFHLNGLTIRNHAFNITGLFDTRLSTSEDALMWIKLAASCNLAPGRLEQNVAMKLTHNTNITNNRDQFFSDQRMMFLYAYDWSKEKKLSIRHKELIIYAYLNHFYYYVAISHSKSNKYIFRIFCWFQLLIRNPELIFSKLMLVYFFKIFTT